MKDERRKLKVIKKNGNHFVIWLIFRTFATKVAKVLRLGNKNKLIYFVLLSTFRTIVDK